MKFTSKTHLSPPTVAYPAAPSKEVILLLIHCLLFVGVLCSVLVLLFSTLYPSGFAIILMVKRELVALLYHLPDVL